MFFVAFVLFVFQIALETTIAGVRSRSPLRNRSFIFKMRCLAALRALGVFAVPLCVPEPIVDPRSPRPSKLTLRWNCRLCCLRGFLPLPARILAHFLPSLSRILSICFCCFSGFDLTVTVPVPRQIVFRVEAEVEAVGSLISDRRIGVIGGHSDVQEVRRPEKESEASLGHRVGEESGIVERDEQSRGVRGRSRYLMNDAGKGRAIGDSQFLGVGWVSSLLGFSRMRSRVMPGVRVDSAFALTAGAVSGPTIVKWVAMMPSRLTPVKI